MEKPQSPDNEQLIEGAHADALPTAPACCPCGVRHAAAGLAVVVVLALALRLFALSDRCFHGDELLSIQLVSEYPLSALPEVTIPAWHPPLHYAVPKLLWLAGARTEAEWRLPGVIAGVILVIAIYLLPLVGGAPRLALPAGVLAAVSPLGVLFSQTDRWHPLVAAMLAVGLVATACGLKSRLLWVWMVAGLFYGLAFETVYLAAVPAGAAMLMALWWLRTRREDLTGWVAGAATGLFVSFPALPTMLKWLQPGGGADSLLGTLAKVALVAQNLVIGPTVMPWNWLVTIPGLALVGAVVYRFATSGDESIRALRLPCAAFLVLCLPAMLLSPVTASSRYWLVLLVPVMIVLAGGLLSISTRRWQMLAAAGIALIFGYGLLNLYTQREYQYLELVDDWKQLVGIAREQVGPGDQVWSTMDPFAHYYGPECVRVFQWQYEPGAVGRHLREQPTTRVLLQYSPMSGWGPTDFGKVGEMIGEQLEARGFERKLRAFYGKDPDAAAKRRFYRGREFADFRHCIEVWVRQ